MCASLAKSFCLGAIGMTGAFGVLDIDPASADVARGKAWVWASQPNDADYAPPQAYQYNSSGLSNRITHRPGRLGQYQVHLPGLATASGMVQVSAYGGNHHCKVENWAPSGPSQVVNVLCFGASGEPANGPFSLLFVKQSPGDRWPGDNAYLWANQPTSASYRPAPSYSWNSKNGANSIRRQSEGVYLATLPGLTRQGGTAMVTAYGSGSERCHVASWSTSGAGTDVNVRCYSAAGRPTDTRFVLNYMTDVGVGSRVAEDDHYGGYVWANRAPTPSPTYQFNNAQPRTTISMVKRGPGTYSVAFPLSITQSKTTALVTAYGATSNYCNVKNWSGNGNSTSVNVQCYAAHGTPDDTKFTLTFLTNRNVLH